MSVSVFRFPTKIEASIEYSVVSQSAFLGDGAISTPIPCGRYVAESWQLETIAKTETEKNAILNTLLNNAGSKDFSWRLREPYFNENNIQITPDEYGDFVSERWEENRLGENCWSFTLNIEKTDIYKLDECVLRAPDLSEDLPILPLNLYRTSPTQSYETKLIKNQYDNGIIERREYGYNAVRDKWELSANLNEQKKEEIVQFLKDRCGASFGFKPTANSATRSYNCLNWRLTWLGWNYWTITLTLEGNANLFRQSYIKELSQLFDFYDNEDAIRGAIASDLTDLDAMINASPNFINTYTRNTVPFLITADYEVINNFHPNILGRGGYFPSAAFPTEAQAVAMRSAIKAHLVTGNTAFRQMAINYGNALLNRFYPVPIPSNWAEANGIRIPHWLRFKNYRSVNFPLKGAIAVDPLSYGYFDLVINFVNGEGTIPTGSPNFGNLLSNVYRVYPAADRLLWRNVYAQPIGGFWHEIDYWVSWNENGINTRYFSDTESPGGRTPVSTSEPVGKIKLTSSFTGAAKVVYAARTGYVAAPGESLLLEPFPMWRTLRADEALGAIDIFPWAHEGYDLLYQVTNDTKWNTARACTEYTEQIAAIVINPSAWYKKDDSPNAFAYAGSQFIPVPDTRGYTASRVTTGAFKDYLRVDIDNSPEPFPSGEYQNFAVQILAASGMTVTVEAGASTPTELEIVLSLSQDPFDFSLYYVARLGVGANTPTSRTFALNEFLLWDLNITSWHPYIAETPIYDYAGLGGAVLEKSRLETLINEIPRNVWKIRLDRNNGFVGAGFVMLGIRPRFPLRIFMKHSGACDFKATIGGVEYFCPIPSTPDWALITLNATQFEDFNNNKPSTSSTIEDLQIVPSSNTVTETWIWYIGSEPKQIQAPAQTYKAAIATRIKTAHSLYVGDFFATGSPTEDLAYGDSAVVFTANAESDGQGGQFIAAWRGLKATGYQYPAYYVRTQQWRRLRGVLQFLLDAQEARKQKLGFYYTFESAFVTPYWDNIEYSENGELNVWVSKFSDPNYFWVGYSVRPLESVAEAWYRLITGDHPGMAPPDRDELIKKCKTICDRYAFWLSSFYVRRRKYSPPTIFFDTEEPTATYHEPHAASFYLGFSVYALLAGGNKALYWRLLKASYNYIQDSFVSSGVMAGSFAGLQPDFTEGSFTGKEYFGFWHFEILERLCLLKQKKDALPYPKCVYFIKKGSFQL